jgi:hypothetical protein
MHGGHEHDHFHGHSNGNGGGALAAPPAGIGHNRPSEARRPMQWQTPHREDAPGGGEGRPRAETDLDLVEAAFVEGFLVASDATSFLRLARVPFEGTAADGAKLALLRVEVDSVADVGSITPHLGGATFRYDPLPARMVSHRKRLRLVYFDGQKPRALDLAEAISLTLD